MASKKLLSVVKERVSSDVNIPFSGKTVTFLNPYSYLLGRKAPLLFDKFDIIYIDGGLFSKILSVAFGKKIQRISFDMTSMAPEVFEFAENNGLTVYFLGARNEEIKRAVQKIKKKYPNMEVAGYRSGYFDDAERIKAIENIVKINPDVFIAGMGVIRQENIVQELRDKGWNGVAFTCGGFLHQTAASTSDLVYYPPWINKMGLRWLYRIIDEPKLFVRYFFYYPIALSLIFTDIFFLFKYEE